MTGEIENRISNQNKLNNVFTKNNYYLSTFVISPDQKNINLGTIIAKGNTKKLSELFDMNNLVLLSMIFNDLCIIRQECTLLCQTYIYL